MTQTYMYVASLNYRGPLPLRELHSTDDTIDIVWRDPGGSWACLRPVSDLTSEFILSEAVGDTDIHVFVKQVVFLTVNPRGPLPLRELHSTDDTIGWRDPGGSWACLRPVSDDEWIHPSRGWGWHKHNYICICHLYEVGRFSYGESPRTSPLEGTSLHRRNDSVERPWGIWACLRPFHDYEWFEPARGCRWHRHVGSLWSKPHGAVRFSYHGSARGGRGGGTQLFPITNGREGWGYPAISDYHWLSHKHMACKWIK